MQRLVAILLLTLVLSVKAQNVSRIHQTLEMPQWSSQPIVFSNEIKGGIHTVATVTEMNSIPTERKQSGMLCVVGSITWNPATDKVYQYDGTTFKPISLLRVWEALGTYITGQITVYNGKAFLSLSNHTGSVTTPDADATNWISLYQLSQNSHSPVTVGTSNGLSLSGQVLSLAPATSSAAGALTATDKTKLDALNTSTVTAGNILVANGTQWNSVAASGNVTINSAGVTTIADNAITSSKIANGTILPADIANAGDYLVLRTDGNGTPQFGQILSSHISQGTISHYDLSAMDANPGQVMKRNTSNSPNWIAADDNDSQTAAQVPVTPSGNLGSTNTQLALQELQSDIDGVKTLTNGSIFVGNASNQAAALVMSGDATLSNTGVVTIANNAVTTAKIADAAITSAKIATGVSLNLSPTANLTGSATYSGNYEVAQVGEAVVFGDVLYFDFATLKWRKARADNFSTTPVQRMALETLAADGTGKLLIEGFVQLNSWSFTAAPIYLSAATPGAVTSTQPSTTGNQIQRIGLAFASNKLHFKPSMDVGEL